MRRHTKSTNFLSSIFLGLLFVLLLSSVHSAKAAANIDIELLNDSAWYPASVPFTIKNDYAIVNVVLLNQDNNHSDNIYFEQVGKNRYGGELLIQEEGNYFFTCTDSMGQSFSESFLIKDNLDLTAPSIAFPPSGSQIESAKDILVFDPSPGSGLYPVQNYRIFDANTSNNFLVSGSNLDDLLQNLGSGTYSIEVTAKDRCGNTAKAKSDPLWFEVKSPTLNLSCSQSPANNIFSKDGVNIDISINSDANFRYYEINGQIFDIGNYCSTYHTVYKTMQNGPVNIKVKTRTAEINENNGAIAEQNLLISNIDALAPAIQLSGLRDGGSLNSFVSLLISDELDSNNVASMLNKIILTAENTSTFQKEMSTINIDGATATKDVTIEFENFILSLDSSQSYDINIEANDMAGNLASLKFTNQHFGESDAISMSTLSESEDHLAFKIVSEKPLKQLIVTFFDSNGIATISPLYSKDYSQLPGDTFQDTLFIYFSEGQLSVQIEASNIASKEIRESFLRQQPKPPTLPNPDENNNLPETNNPVPPSIANPPAQEIPQQSGSVMNKPETSGIYRGPENSMPIGQTPSYLPITQPTLQTSITSPQNTNASTNTQVSSTNSKITVKNEKAKIYTTASSNSKVMGVARTGQRFSIIGESPNYYKIAFYLKSKPGQIRYGYIQKSDIN